ncbi:MAG: cyclic nucleotide-binding domain-containing protein [Actinomycetota bacterium]|nr:cyclic nucleotide-binding domain-containing protein [Actinomycetota bacterium]
MAVTNPVTRLPALRPVPIFRGLTKAELLQVARKAVEIAHPQGTSVVRQGDPGDALCIIAEGSVEVRRDGHVVAQMTVGEFFGELSLIDGEPRSATVVAVEDVVLLTLSAADFDSLLSIPYVARAALKSLAERIRQAHDSHGPECI